MPNAREQWKNGLQGRPLCLWVLMAILSISCLGMGSHRGDTDKVLTIEALYKLCHLPADCSAPTDWEGETVIFSGRLDPANIFDREHYPKLPYEKFRLIGASGRSVEIWPEAGDNSTIFKKLSARSSDEATVTGRLKAVKLPISNECKLGIKVVIDHADQVEFK